MGPHQRKKEHPKRKKLKFGLVFVVDISGSLVARLSDSKRAARALLDAVPVGSTVGLITFDVHARELWPLSVFTAVLAPSILRRTTSWVLLISSELIILSSMGW